jgi:hypothetical protein
MLLMAFHEDAQAYEARDCPQTTDDVFAVALQVVLCVRPETVSDNDGLQLCNRATRLHGRQGLVDKCCHSTLVV